MEHQADRPNPPKMAGEALLPSLAPSTPGLIRR